MEKQTLIFNEDKEYQLVTNKVELALTGVFGALFVFAIKGGNAANIAFFAVSAVFFAYYFIWYKKRPPYIVLSGDKVTVHNGLFFKPVVIETESIVKVRNNEKEIIIEYRQGDVAKSIKIYAFLMFKSDFKELFKLLTGKPQE